MVTTRPSAVMVVVVVLVLVVAATRPGAATGPAPSSAFEVAVGRAGKMSAAAGSDVSPPSPLTTARYAPAAPATVSSPIVLTASALRGGGRRPSYRLDCSSTGNPPKVLIPVDVMSGPPAGGSTGCFPRS